MNVLQFFKKYFGKGVDFDKSYGLQCMDYAEQYNKEVVKAPRIGGDAKDAWTRYSKKHYKKVVGGVPKLGDLVVWGTKIGQYGHISVATGKGNRLWFQSVDQNWGQGLPRYVNHSYYGVLGYLRPIKKVNITLPKKIMTRLYHTVKEGDTLTKIAKRYGLTLQQVIRLNPQSRHNPSLIYPGQKIRVR